MPISARNFSDMGEKTIIQLFCSEIKGSNSPVTYFLDRMEFEMLTYSKYVFNLLL